VDRPAAREHGEIYQRVLRVVQGVLGAESPMADRGTRLTEDLDFDSLLMLELALALEDEFDLPEVRTDEVGGGTEVTIGDLVRIVGEHGR